MRNTHKSRLSLFSSCFELEANELLMVGVMGYRVGATLGLATGYILQKQGARARNVLKRVAKAVWLVEEAEYLERCWLLLADLQVINVWLYSLKPPCCHNNLEPKLKYRSSLMLL